MRKKVLLSSFMFLPTLLSRKDHILQEGENINTGPIRCEHTRRVVVHKIMGFVGSWSCLYRRMEMIIGFKEHREEFAH